MRLGQLAGAGVGARVPETGISRTCKMEISRWRILSLEAKKIMPRTKSFRRKDTFWKKHHMGSCNAAPRIRWAFF